LEPRRFDRDRDRLSPREGSETGRAVVLEPRLRDRASALDVRATPALRSPEARLDEAAGLARVPPLSSARARSTKSPGS